MDEPINEKTFGHYIRNALRALDDAIMNLTVAEGTPFEERTLVLEKLIDDILGIYRAIELFKRPTFSDEENDQIRKAAMRALATVDDATPEEPNNAEDDVEIGGVMTIEEVEREEQEEKNGDDRLSRF